MSRFFFSLLPASCREAVIVVFSGCESLRLAAFSFLISLCLCTIGPVLLILQLAKPQSMSFCFSCSVSAHRKHKIRLQCHDTLSALCALLISCDPSPLASHPIPHHSLTKLSLRLFVSFIFVIQFEPRC